MLNSIVVTYLYQINKSTAWQRIVFFFEVHASYFLNIYLSTSVQSFGKPNQVNTLELLPIATKKIIALENTAKTYVDLPGL